MKCSKCNQEIDDNSIFCEFCGTKIEQAPATEEPSIKTSVEPTPTNNDPIATPWWKQNWVIPASILLALVITSVIVLATGSGNEAIEEDYDYYVEGPKPEQIEDTTYYSEEAQPVEETEADYYYEAEQTENCETPAEADYYYEKAEATTAY